MQTCLQLGKQLQAPLPVPAGEGGAIASPPALANAINDALAPLGIHLTRQPLDPSAILTALMA